MKAFEDGQRVRYVGTTGYGSEYKGREGAVQDSYRDYDGYRVLVLLDGEKRGLSFDEDDFEAVKTTYRIENNGEDITSATMDLTDTEAALLKRVIEAVNDENYKDVPVLSMTKEDK